MMFTTAVVLAAVLQLPATGAGSTTAFGDSAARATLLRARAARLAQDSAITAYDATSYQRYTSGVGLTRIDHQRTVFAFEMVGRVRWRRGRGVWADLEGSRTLNAVGPSVPVVPYYPGMEALWMDAGMFKNILRDVALVHPIAAGSEARYTYESGPSISFRLPDGKTIRIHELRVRPRTPSSRLVIGSFWFDEASGQLVRAAYRPSLPHELTFSEAALPDSSKHATSIWQRAVVRALTSPARLEVASIVVEYGLYAGRFWLPRERMLDGSVTVNALRGTATLEQRFSYTSVNAPDTLPAFTVRPDTIDTRGMSEGNKARVVAGLVPDSSGMCDHDSTFRATSLQDGVPVAMVVPCDLSKLGRSPALPPSIFSESDAAAAEERRALAASALSVGSLPWGLTRLAQPRVGAGLHWLRYNRIEGLSLGAAVDQPLGVGYDVQATGRFGFSDRVPEATVGLARGNGADTVRFTGYRRLTSAGDWGDPLSFSSSLSAMLFGHDDGFYYRATGAELAGRRTPRFAGGSQLAWRVFFERERSATPTHRTSPFGSAFAPNVAAEAGDFTGVALRADHAFGANPWGPRLLATARFEAATGADDYARAALEATASRPLAGSTFLGPNFGALTLSGGTSAGALPPQRRWFLGGVQTVRGLSPDTAHAGDAYWFARSELGTGQVLRVSLFYDVGWAGDRAHVTRVGRPLSGAGVGVSLLDGLLRLDVARGIAPVPQWRIDLSMGARF